MSDPNKELGEDLLPDKENNVSVEDLEKKIVRQEKRDRDKLIDILNEEGFARKDLQEITTSDLRKLVNAKEEGEEVREMEHEEAERNKLIKKLSARGLSEEKLKMASIKDLKSLWSKYEDKENTVSEEDMEKYIEEARKDLARLMISSEDMEEREDRKVSSKVTGLAKNLSKKFNASATNGGKNMRKYNFKRTLDSYSDLSKNEAAVKTACLFKGYLEIMYKDLMKLNYKELSERIPSENQRLRDLSRFFRMMHQNRGLNELSKEEVKKAIENCKYMVDNFNFEQLKRE